MICYTLLWCAASKEEIGRAGAEASEDQDDAK